MAPTRSSRPSRRATATAFGDRLHVVRGNHDAYRGQQAYTGDEWIDLPGVSIALLDTVIPEHTTGTISPAQLQWLDDLSAAADRPVIVMGHHQQWVAGRPPRRILRARPRQQRRSHGSRRQRPRDRRLHGRAHPSTSRPVRWRVACRRSRSVASRTSPAPGPSTACTRAAITQVVHRMSSPEALRWSDRCRHLMSDFGIDYETYALGNLEDRCFNIPLR